MEEAFDDSLQRLAAPEAAKPPPWMSAPELEKKIRLAMKPDPGEWLIFSTGEGEERSVQLAQSLPPAPVIVPVPK